MFISNKGVPVTIDGTNIIYIRPKMDYGTSQKVQGALARTVSQNGGEGFTAELDLARANILLLTANILNWEGPDFVDPDTGYPLPCNPTNIERMDPDAPLLDKVLTEINARNTKAKPAAESEDESKSPNSTGGGTTASNGRAMPKMKLVENMTSISS